MTELQRGLYEQLVAEALEGQLEQRGKVYFS